MATNGMASMCSGVLSGHFFRLRMSGSSVKVCCVVSHQMLGSESSGNLQVGLPWTADNRMKCKKSSRGGGPSSQPAQAFGRPPPQSTGDHYSQAPFVFIASGACFHEQAWGRTTWMRHYKVSGGTDIAKLAYGYSPASDRLYQQDLVTTTDSELYGVVRK